MFVKSKICYTLMEGPPPAPPDDDENPDNDRDDDREDDEGEEGEEGKEGKKSRSCASTCSGISASGNNEDVDYKMVNHPKTVIRWKYDFIFGE